MSADTPETDRDRMQVLTDHFHSQADECRQMAERTTSPPIEAEWRRLAEAWEKLALSASAVTRRQ